MVPIILAEKIHNLFAGYPNVLYGFSDTGFSEYRDQYASALVFAVPYGRRLSLKTYDEKLFTEDITEAREGVEEILTGIKQLLEESGISYFVPQAGQRDEFALMAPFSYKYAAVKAGLGWIGRNDALITEEYGPRLRLSAVLIGAALPTQEGVTQSKCPEFCMECVSHCPHKALKGSQWMPDSKREDLIDIHRCNQKRSVTLPKWGRKNSCGFCIAACPFGIE